MERTGEGSGGRASGGWKDVYRDLRGRIDDGRLAPGAALPTLSALARSSGLTPHGARRVMARLRDEGRVQSWQGLGHRVAEARVAYRIAMRTRFGANLVGQGRSASCELMAARTVPLPHGLARDMRLAPATRVHQAEMLRRVEGAPVLLSRSHFPTGRFDGILDDLAATGSVTDALAAHGVADYRRQGTRIEVRLPRAHEGLMLEIPPSQPVIVTVGTNVDPEGEVVELAHSVWRADRVAFEV